MGSESLPDLPISKSVHFESSSTEWREKNILFINFFCISSVMAFIPFSQYSPKEERSSSGSGQAQPGQLKPPFWFILKDALMASRGLVYFDIWLSEDCNAPNPALFFDGALVFKLANASGVFDFSSGDKLIIDH